MISRKTLHIDCPLKMKKIYIKKKQPYTEVSWITIYSDLIQTLKVIR